MTTLFAHGGAPAAGPPRAPLSLVAAMRIRLWSGPRWRLALGLALAAAGGNSLAAAAPASNNDGVTRSTPRGSVSALGSAWFANETRAPAVDEDEDEAEEDDDEDGPPGFWQSWSLSAGTGIAYASRPARTAQSTSNWAGEIDLAAENEIRLGEAVTLTPSLGLSSVRYASQTSLNADEPYAGLALTWKVVRPWTLSLREESFWDLQPQTGASEFSAHALLARVQFDAPATQPHARQRWQVYSELAFSHASTRVQDFRGFDVGVGDAVKLVPALLTLQFEGGLAWVQYPNFRLEDGARRQGWDSYALAAIVWRPRPALETSAGVDVRRSRERGALYRFTSVTVPIRVTASF